MDYKEKLRLAKEALESGSYDKDTIEYIFPELYESEDDVIRKAILELVKQSSEILDKQNQNNMINWLEKQGDQKSVDKEYTFKSIPRLLDMIEPTDRAKSYCKKLIDSLQTEGYSIDAKIVGECLKQMNGEKVAMATMDNQNPADKVEPKFKVGDWITDGYLHNKITDVLEDRYIVDTKFAKRSSIPFKFENYYHLWTIQDAKDGDVLVGKIDGDDYILIFKQIKDGWIETYGHYYYAVDRFCAPSQLFCRDCKGTFYPATKEQRDLLFQKMKEEGYEWSEETHELKKISQRMVSAEAKEALYDKPTDEEMKELLRTEYEKGRADTIAEMKSSWSEEDEHLSYWTIHNLTELKNRFGENYGDSGKCIDWIKQLKQRIGG